MFVAELNYEVIKQIERLRMLRRNTRSWTR